MEKGNKNGGLTVEYSADSIETPLSLGLQQYCNIYMRYKDLLKDGLHWGDETEYMIVSMNHELKFVNPLPKAPDVLRRVGKKSGQNGPAVFIAMPESTDFQIETIPMTPYSGRLEDLGLVEDNMKTRRDILTMELPSGAELLTIPSFPGMWPSRSNEQLLNTPGFDNFVVSKMTPRFMKLFMALQQRRGDDYSFDIPVYRDLNTEPSLRYLILRSKEFLLTCNALQVTIEAKHLQEACYLHDQLVVLSPILIALTAGTPTVNGYLTENDSRLGILSKYMDDRTLEEKHPSVDRDGHSAYRHPRYGPVTWYINEESQPCNDLMPSYSVPLYNELIKKGMDKRMAKHGAILLSHPIDEDVKRPSIITEVSTNLLERINKSVWPHVRLKPPSVDGTLGWRLEFRPMAVQPTDYENAAFAVFVLLLTRTIRHSSPNFIIPMSKVHENYHRAITRDAIRRKKFYFRSENICDTSPRYTVMTANEIVNGTSEFPGLISLIRQFLDSELHAQDVSCKVESYLQLISDIASGKRPTVARRIREFVVNHPEYRRDSKVSERMQYDLITSFLIS